MNRKLLGDASDGPISPLIDVVMNGMAAMFIILMVYLFVARPTHPDPLRFLEEVEPPPAVAGQSYTFTFPVAGGVGARLFSADGALPAGLELDAETGTVFGIPAAVSQQHRFDLAVEVRDTKFQDRREATVVVFPAVVPHDPGRPAFAIVRQAEDLPTGRLGADYEAVLGARGGVAPHRWRLSGGRLPGGLDLEEGQITGVPKQAGVFEFSVEAWHSEGSFADRGKRRSWRGGSTQRNFRLRVLELIQPSFKPPLGRAGEPYFASLGMGALLPGEEVSWQGEVPGVTASGTGMLSGRPLQAGSYQLTYTVGSGSQSPVSGSAEVKILPPRPARQVGPARIVAQAGEEIRYSLPYRGLREPVIVRWLTELPAGLRAQNGAVTGNAEGEGKTRLPYEVTDALGEVAGGELDLVVRPPRTPLSVSGPAALDLVVNEPVALQWVARGGEGEYRWETAGLPEGLEASEQGTVTGRLAKVGSWQVELTVHDPTSGESARRTATLRGLYAETSGLRWASTAVPVALVGFQFEFAFAVVGGVGEPTFKLEGELPAGLEFTPVGIRGTALEPGRTEIVVRAFDAVGQSAPAVRFVVASEAADASVPIVRTAELPPALIGRKYELDFAAEGGVDFYSWRFQGNLPPGLAFGERGIRGTVDPGFTGGNFPIQATVADARGREAEKAYLLHVVGERAPAADATPAPVTDAPKRKWMVAVASLVLVSGFLFFAAGKRSGRRAERSRLEGQFRSMIARRPQSRP